MPVLRTKRQEWLGAGRDGYCMKARLDVELRVIGVASDKIKDTSDVRERENVALDACVKWSVFYGGVIILVSLSTRHEYNSCAMGTFANLTY